MPLIRLLADPEDESLPPPPPKLPGADFPIDSLLLELHRERQKAKHREAAFLSVIAHLSLVILLLLSPKLFHPAAQRKLVTPQQDLQQHQLTYLELPKDLITKKKPVAPKALSDRDRAVDRKDKITNSLSVPLSRPAPRPVPATPPPGASRQPTREAPPPTPPPSPAPPAKQPGADAAKSATAKPAPEGLKLEDVPAPAKPKLNLNIGSLGSINRAIQQAARDRTAGGASVSESAPLPPRPAGGESQAPGQTGAGVQILTDTQGVDFNSYLQRVIEITRRNWYAVMPETVYLGTQGRVVVDFSINANGSVPGLQLMSGSGTVSLDQAAQASISASNPYPPLPREFHGPFIRLRFSFYYNLAPPGSDK